MITNRTDDAMQILDDTSRNIFDREAAVYHLAEDPTPEHVERLVAALEDDAFGVRWAAAVGLAQVGRPALRPLLRALVAQPDSVWLREGAYHVLHYIADRETYRQTAPLRDALKGPGAEFSTAQVAGEMLAALGW